MNQSGLLCAFLSKGYFASRNCMREAGQAVRASKPIITVRETAVMHGGASRADFIHQCADNLIRLGLFGDDLERPSISCAAADPTNEHDSPDAHE